MGSVIEFLRQHPDDFPSHKKAFDRVVAELKTTQESGDRRHQLERRDALVSLLAIRGENRDLNQRRVRWNRVAGQLLR